MQKAYVVAFVIFFSLIVMTPLKVLMAQTYAIAQGNLVVGGWVFWLMAAKPQSTFKCFGRHL